VSQIYKNPTLFISVIFIGGVIVLSLTINSVNNIKMVDVIFLTGLVIFIVGGFLWIIEKGIYTRTFKNFKKLLKHTSKVESYVENYDVGTVKRKSYQRKNRKSIPLYMFANGIILIVISTILAIL